jgi:membrane carboxypeptidase/penicillin-binding protein
MSVESQIIRSRQRRNQRRRKNLSKRLGKIAIVVLIITSLLTSILVIALSFLYANILNDIPSYETLPLIFESKANQLHEPTRLYDHSGQHVIAVLENPNARGKQYLSINKGQQEEIPEALIQATILSTEPNFWNNPGLSWESLQDVNQPTIAQKLIRLYLIEEESGSTRQSFQEWLLAAQLIASYGHEQILEWYLNSEHYGNLAYGADAAAKIYFDKSASELNHSEAAMLAAVAQSPARNPIDAPDAAQEAKIHILNEMFELGFISADQLKTSLEQELEFSSSNDFPVNLAPAFTNLVIEQASQFISKDQIFRGGLDIITSLDYELQSQVECAVEHQLNRTTGETSSNLTRSNFDDCEMARLLPSNFEGISGQDFPISTNVLVMDPHAGQILAMLGDSNGRQEQDDFSGHPPGSTLTPFIYLTSFTRGSSPATLLWDIPANIPSGLSDIQGEIDQFHGPVSIRTALANDYIGPALQILNQMDPDQVWQTAERLGLTRLQVPSGDGNFSVLFQGGETNLVELSQAYSVLANQGVSTGISQNNGTSEETKSPIHPQVVLRITDDSGNVHLDCTDQITECHVINRPVITQELAYLVTDVLSDETARWPSLGHPNSLEIGRPAAAKIGGTKDGEDIWTIGYTTDLLTAVWVGTENSSQDLTLPPEWAAGLWHAVIQYATNNLPLNEFVVPTSLNEIQVCNPSGLLPSKDCPQIINEIFISGNEPTQSDYLYKTFLVNQESGRLATVFTSPALIEEKVFMVVPPEAEEWARIAGVPQIPEAYDVLDVEQDQIGDARISSPTMFSTINGSVPIIGRAAGDGFQSYRLQVGAGLNPNEWLQIGEVFDEPVENGQLGMWDTTELSGLYVVQLIASFEDDRVETSIIQVTIDNQDPEVDIRYPKDGQIFNLNEFETITMQIDASDNMGIERVEIFINGDLSATLNTPPYAIPWKLNTGEYIIRVIAYDQAGNKDDVRLQIFVEQ